MLTLTLNGKEIETKKDLYASVRAQLPVPVWFGENLDALYDVITCDILPGQELTVVIAEKEAMAAHLGEYSTALFGLLDDIAAEDRRLILCVE